MSTRSRAVPWFGTKGARDPDLLRSPSFAPAPTYTIDWTPGDRERLGARGVFVDEEAFVAATRARMDRMRAHAAWWESVDPVGMAALRSGGG